MLHEPPFLPYGGVYVGHAGFTRAFGAVVERLDLSRLKIERKVAQDDRVFAVVRIPAHAGGEVVLAEEWCVRDGKAVEIHIYFHDSASMPLSDGMAQA